MRANNLVNKTVYLTILLVVIAIYASLELILNYLLVETYENSALALFSEKQDRVVQIGFFGRILSGFGLTLLIFGVVGGALRWFNIYRPELASQGTSRTLGKLAKPLMFVCVWGTLIIGIEVFVDVAAARSSAEAKLGATRAVIFREAYRSGQITFESAPQMDAFLEDEINRKISIALIPSLAYFSDKFKNQIRDQLENIVANNVEQNRRKEYLEKVPQILRTIEQTARNEVAAFQGFDKAMTAANKKLSSGAIQSEYQGVMKSISDERRRLWRHFRTETNADNMGELADKVAIEIFSGNFDARKRMRKCEKRKDQACIQAEKQRHREYIQSHGLNWESWEYWNETSFWRSLGQLVTLPVAYTSCLTEVIGRVITSEGKQKCESTIRAISAENEKALEQRKKYLSQKYGLPLNTNEPGFQKADYVARELGKHVSELGYELGSEWRRADSGHLLNQIETRFKNAREIAIRTYHKQSRFDFEYGAFRNAGDLVKHPSMTKFYRSRLGEYFFEGYLPFKNDKWLDEAAFYHEWSKTVPTSLEYVKLFSDESMGAFESGGAFYQLGKDSVAFAIIPPVSIVLSALAVFGLFFKLINKFVFSVVASSRRALSVIAVITLLIITIATSKAAILLDQETSGAGVSLSLFGSDIEQPWSEQAIGFGLALDLERAVYEVASKKNNDASTILEWLSTEDMKVIIEKEKKFRAKVSKLLLKDSRYDLSVSVFDKERRMAYSLAMGFDDKDQVNRIKIPNFFANTEFGRFLEIPLFFSPNYKSLLLESAMNAADVEFWLDIHSGSLVRESAMERIEKSLLARLKGTGNDNFPIQFEGKPVTQGNLLAFRSDSSDSYKCIYMESIDYRLLELTIRATIDGDKSLTECTVEI
jgi:hypothetical protein